MIRFISKNNRWLLVSHLSFFPSFFLFCFFLSSLVLHPIALRYDQRSYVGLCVQWNLDIINEPLHNEFLCLTNDILFHRNSSIFVNEPRANIENSSVLLFRKYRLSVCLKCSFNTKYVSNTGKTCQNYTNNIQIDLKYIFSSYDYLVYVKSNYWSIINTAIWLVELLLGYML